MTPPADVRGVPVAVVEDRVEVGGRRLSILRPRDSEALLDEEAFEHEEFLPYWAELWPSALALADAVAGRVRRGPAVLELGCGLGVPSIVAALEGSQVLATDWSPDAVSFCALNAKRNGVPLDAALLSWAAPDPALLTRRWDVVLAADVLYERRNVALLLALLPRLVDAQGEVLLADPGRPAWPDFAAAARELWHVERLAGGGARGVYRLQKRPRRRLAGPA